MKKIKMLISVIFILIIPLAACQTAPKKEDQIKTQPNETTSTVLSSIIKNDDSSISFKLNIGNSKHFFLVNMDVIPMTETELEQTEFYDSKLRISIFNENNTAYAYQIIEGYTTGTLFKDYKVEDVNFDGYLDFFYVHSRGNANIFYSFWLWDSKVEKFIESKELNDISLPSFDSKTKVVRGFNRGSAASNEHTYYKYINGNLTCIRILEMGYPDENNNQLLTVQDYVDGKLIEAFSKITILTNDFTGKTYDEFFKWEDLSYHGAN